MAATPESAHDQPLWPDVSQPGLDEAHIARGEWHVVFGRWHHTIRCFVDVVSLAPPGPVRERLHNALAYQIMVGAANECAELEIPWEHCLLTVLANRMTAVMDTWARRYFASGDHRLQAFLALSGHERLLVTYYDADREGRSAQLGAEDGVFTNSDVARLLLFGNEAALRQAAGRARAKFERLIADYAKRSS